jgi:predicted hotdog family 3-hydroxylacyl-ACP dehydratase
VSGPHKSDGRTVGAAAGGAACGGFSLPLAVECLLPHRDRMSFLSELIEHSESDAMARVAVDEQVYLREDDSLDPIALVEYAAQLCAAAAGYRMLIQGLPLRLGLLVGIRSFDVFDTITRGDVLSIRMHRKVEMPPIFHTACTIHAGERKIASGTLKLWEFEPSELPEAGGTGSADLAGIGGNNENPDRTGPWSMIAAVREIMGDIRIGTDGSDGQGTIEFQAGFRGFKGHFPDYPVVPGVSLLTAMGVVAEECVGTGLRVTRIERAKFGKVIFPNEAAIVRVELQPAEGDRFRVTGTVERDGTELARCRFIAGPAV